MVETDSLVCGQGANNGEPVTPPRRRQTLSTSHIRGLGALGDEFDETATSRRSRIPSSWKGRNPILVPRGRSEKGEPRWCGLIPTTGSHAPARWCMCAGTGADGRLDGYRPVSRFRIRLRRKSTTDSRVLPPDGFTPPGGFFCFARAMLSSTSRGSVRKRRSSASSGSILSRIGETGLDFAICSVSRSRLAHIRARRRFVDE
jgi:hypothetical protein